MNSVSKTTINILSGNVKTIISILVFILLITSCIKVYARDLYSISTNFSPIKQLEQQPLGKKLIALYEQAKTNPRVTHDKLIKLSSSNDLVNSALYQFAYYRILHAVELSRDNPKQAQKAINELYQYASNNDLDWLVAESQLWQATFLSKQGNIEKSIHLLQQVLNTAKRVNYTRLVARAYNARAIMYSIQNHNYLAIKDYLYAFDILKVSDKDPYLSIITSNMAVIFGQTEQWDKAIKYNQMALDYYNNNDRKNNELLANIHVNFAFFFKNSIHKGASELERKHLDKAYEYAQSSGNSYTQTTVLSNLSEYWLNHNEIDLAQDTANTCLDKAIKNKAKISIGFCSLQLAKVYNYQNKYKKAEPLLKQSEETFVKSEINDGLIDVYQQLLLLYQETNQYKSAVNYSTLYYEAKNKNLFTKRQQQLNELEQKYTSENKQQKILLLSAENELKATQLSEQSLREMLMIIGLLFSFAIIYISFKRSFILELYNKTLESKNITLFEQSHQDTLTGLYNRRYFENKMNELIKGAELNKNFYMLAILDIDHFKKINDTYGHDMGDEVLCNIATVLKSNIRLDDMIVRWGGEEFVILLSHQSPDKFEQGFFRLKEAIANLAITTSSNDEINVTVSIGTSSTLTVKQLCDNYNSELTKADKYLYLAKSSGRNCIKFADH